MARNCVYIPDYTVRVVQDCLILKVTSSIYKQALLSTKLKTWEPLENEADDGEELDVHVGYDVDDDDSESNSNEPFSTPGATPMLRRSKGSKTNYNKAWVIIVSYKDLRNHLTGWLTLQYRARIVTVMKD